MMIKMSIKTYCLFMFIALLTKLSQQQDNTTLVTNKSNLINGILYTSTKAEKNQPENIVFYDSGSSLYKGLTLRHGGDNMTSTRDTYRIVFKLQLTNDYLNDLLNETHVSGSRARVELLNFVANKLNISDSDVKLELIESKQIVNMNNQTNENTNNLKLVNLVITRININDTDSCKSYLKQHTSQLAEANNYSQLFATHSSIKQIIRVHFDNYCTASIFDDFLIAVIVPSTIIGSMLIISILLACILHRSNKKRKQKYAASSSSKSNQQIYKQKSYISKGVPVILYEEMAEKANEEEDYDSNGGHRLPLILRNEKPPVPPPEYRKMSTDNNNNNEQQTLNEIQNMINSAPLAIAEQSDDTIAFLSGGNKDDAAYYQPPQPIATLKDVSRRGNLTTSNSNNINISNSYLNNNNNTNNSTNNQQKLQP